MGEGTTPSAWRAIDRRHRAGILLGAAAVLVVAVAAAVALSDREPTRTVDGDALGVLTPAEQTVEGTASVPAYEQTATPGAAEPGDGGNGYDAEGVPTAVARILYRRDGWLCVAAPDGTEERRVVQSAEGVFSLAPDGATIASVDDDEQLRLYDVTSGGTIVVGSAERDLPAWAPDSAWLVYTASGQTVVRVDRDGKNKRALFAGRAAVVARDGATVVAASPATDEPAVLVWRRGAIERRAVDAPITGLACSASHIYVGTGPGATGVSTLWSMALSGAGRRLEITPLSTARGVSFGSLLVSPGDSWVAYAEHGDDDSSRIFAIPATGGAAVTVSGRRDAYPLQWAGAVDTLLLVEGNATQGEPTALISASMTSGVRRLVVQGAGR